ncbi:hypothetical protein MMC10_009865 [Thelotrema lepadinum]|nr:hypothetical protein [Thelotrema lepadinum]
MTLHNDFHHAAYSKVLSFDTTSVSPDAQLPARVLQLRAQIATGEAKEVLSSLSSEGSSPPDLAAVKAYALYAAGSTSEALCEATSLASSAPDNATVQVLAATILHASGQSEDALALLSKHQGSLEAVALTTQIHIATNRTDLALKEVSSAKKWAQDSLLINIAESWVGLRLGGDRYQQAFYEFEEMPVAQSIAETHLGRLPEAETTLRQVESEGVGGDRMRGHALANLAVVQTLAGKSTEAKQLIGELGRRMPEHPLLGDLNEKESLFDEAAKKYAPKVAAS